MSSDTSSRQPDDFSGMLPRLTFEADSVRFFVSAESLSRLRHLPWNASLESWDAYPAQLIPVKSGLSRHVVRFVESDGHRFAIKETTFISAAREFGNYVQLVKKEIPTLAPVGVVVRDEGTDVVRTKVGAQAEQRETAYLVTELMEKVVPDSFLFKRGFTKENRNKIWDAVIQLFVRMHSNGIYWGDASLANMLINFRTETVPELGRRTRLLAVLADAETVEIRPAVSDRLRNADVEFFLESMLWTEADLHASGAVRDPMLTHADQRYVMDHYNEQYAVEQEMRSFELVTHIDVDKLLGNFDAKGYGKLLLQHINEHKWYVSERLGREVSLVEAAEDWYQEVFKPVCRIFSEHGLLEYFPDKTAASLYVEIMEHKYFVSQKMKHDVGLIPALEDYLIRFSPDEALHPKFNSLIRALQSLLSGKSM